MSTTHFFLAAGAGWDRLYAGLLASHVDDLRIGSRIKATRGRPDAGSFDWPASSAAGWGSRGSTFRRWTRGNSNNFLASEHASASTRPTSCPTVGSC